MDGAGDAGALYDLGINGDKISAVGNLENSSAQITIDALGKYVVPGFIDITNHSDTRLTLFKYPHLESLVMQGVTTIIGGNCGASLAPLGSREAIDAIRKWADPSEVNIDWATLDEFLNTVARLTPGVNFGTFIGYGTLRRGVIGNEVRPLTFEEKWAVKNMLRQGITEGAFGLSLGLAYGHEKISTTEEIIEIGKILQETGGIIKIHLRSEGSDLLASVNEAVRIGRETGVPIQISHLKAIGKKSWPYLRKALEFIEKINSSDGLQINFDVSPYHSTGSPLYLLIPHWARQGGFDELFKRIKNYPDKQRIIEALKSHTLHFDKILITSAKIKSIVGHTLAEVAEHSGLSPEEALLDTIRANEGRVTILGKTLSRKNTELEVENKNSFLASDGEGVSQEYAKSGNLIHPRSFGAFPHFWHYFVNDKKSLEPAEALKKITSGPAEKLGIEKRGALKRGNYADVVIFDPRLIKDRAGYKNPFSYPAGIEWVIINGQVVVERGRYLGVRVGKALKRQ